MTDLNALYEQYLGRAPDPSGISTWSGQDEASIIAGILGSQEYQNRGGGGGGDSGGGSPQPSNQDNSNNANTPNSYDDQVALLLSWGVAPDQIQNTIGTRESVNQGLKAQAQEIYDRTGEVPSYAASVGFVPGPPSWLNPQDYRSSGYAAPYTQEQITGAVDPNNYRTMNGQLYASAKGPADLSGGEYLIDPNTGRFKLDASGNPIGVTYPRAKSGTFDSIMETAVPLFIAGASLPVLGGMGAELLGTTSGGFGLTGASGANGAMGASSALQLAPSAGTIGGYGSIAAPSLAGGLGVGAGGVLGAGALSPETIALMEAMNAGAGYGLNASQVPSLIEGLGLDSLSSSLPFNLKDVLSAANTARQVYGLGQTAANILNPSNASKTSSTAPKSGLSNLTSLSDALGNLSLTSGSGALPGNLQATSLAAAPVTQGSSNMNINQLKQLYPQLSTVDPRILSSLTGQSASVPNYYTYGGNQSAGGTALTNQGQGGAPQPGYPSLAADLKSTSTSFASPTSPSSSYNALSAAGLRSLSTGALPGQMYKDGGNVHVPQFKTGTTGHFVQGAGDGQSDDIPAMLADGEYVFDADTVAALGNGSSKAGALQLDKMRKSIRKHKRSAPHDKIPPKAKSPLEYLKG